jgi:hypothetical protein
MREQVLVDAVVKNLNTQGFVVSTEVPVFYRSADVAAVDQDGRVWVIECKISDMSRALTQTRLHKLAADRVSVATPLRKTRDSTIGKLKAAGVGLMYVLPDGRIEEAYDPPESTKPWPQAREQLRRTIIEDRE